MLLDLFSKLRSITWIVTVKKYMIVCKRSAGCSEIMFKENAWIITDYKIILQHMFVNSASLTSTSFRNNM